jgi:hypothetical protein
MGSPINNNAQTNNNSSKYTEKLVALQSKFPGLLTQYQKSFVTYNTNPVDTNEAQSFFFNDRKNLTDVFNELFGVINNIQTDMNVIDASTNILNTSMKKNKQKYSQLTRQFDMYTGKIDTAATMKDDYSKLYFNTFISNISLFIGICLAGTVIFRVFRKSKSIPVAVATPLK